MNLISTQNNQKSSNIRWEPFATSTPLKIVPSNVKVEKNSQKQLKLTDSQGLIRKLQKECSSINDTEKKAGDLKQLVNKLLLQKKSCENLEFSSSSDEDSASEKSRPVIKLGLKNQTTLLLKGKKAGDCENVKIVKNKNTAGSNEARTSTEKNKCGVKDSKQFNSHNKKQNNNVNLGLDNISVDEENIVLDKMNLGNLTNDPKSSFEKKYEHCLKRDENFKHFSNCKFKINKSGNKKKTCRGIKNISQTSNTLQDFERKTLRKKKCDNIEQASNSVKISQSKKAKNKLLISSKDETEKNSMTSLFMSEKKTNTSHQLFSESKVQELINTLNLTSEEVVESKESSRSLLQNKLIQSSLNLPHPSNQRDLIEKQNEHKLRKYNLKNHTSVKSICNLLLPAAVLEKKLELENNSKIFKENNEHILEAQKKTEDEVIPCGNFIKNSSEKDDFNYNKTKRRKHKKAVSSIRKERKTFAAKQAANNSKNIKSDANGARNSLASENVNLSMPWQFIDEDTTGAEKQVFKLINDLSYDENETGCSAIECWNVNTFKCGVFSLKIKSKMNCRTLHSNSYLGGVLVKGNLKMKIGTKELDLKSGDMAFVPPLTDWQATNIGESESVFYYWCGRFKI